jgi:predicted membrane channel-forming protein YqfA (hemolysin III family)
MKTIVIASLFTAFIALVVYLTSIIAVHGIRKSISDSNYFLKKPFKLVFEIVMWVCGLAIITTGLFIKESVDWWVIGGGIGIFLVGVFSDFKRNIYIRIAHYLSAIGGFTLLGLSFFLQF